MTSNTASPQRAEVSAPCIPSIGRFARGKVQLTRAALLGLLVFAVTGLQAQYTRSPARNVTGTVTDAGQEPLRGAVVQIEAADTMVIASFITNDRGEYQFHNLRSDADFTLWATFRGNRSKTHAIGKFDRKLDRDIPMTIVLEK